jgi:hypothetical protein
VILRTLSGGLCVGIRAVILVNSTVIETTSPCERADSKVESKPSRPSSSFHDVESSRRRLPLYGVHVSY